MACRETSNTLRVSGEVERARRDCAPIVALESTVVTHGLPRERRPLSSRFLAAHPGWNTDLPVNLALALACEDAIRARGAVPATVAVINGVPRAGLDRAELELLAQCEGLPKLSSDGLGHAMARHTSGGTTVAATTIIASAARISAFSTGGIGGVHRGWERSLDISADLHAVASHPMLVVSAGPKAILDLPATLEAIETLGIPALGFKTTHLPRFTVEPSRELRLAHTVGNASEAAAVVKAHWSLQPQRGLLLLNPCPTEFAIDGKTAEAAIAHALESASRAGVRGSATTPFLLAALAQSQQGTQILEANLALLIANAGLAAEIAACLHTGSDRNSA